MMNTKHAWVILSVAIILVLTGFINNSNDKGLLEASNSGILKEHMDPSVKPGNDFMKYVNGHWLANTEIPSDKGSYGVSYIVHEESEDKVKAIIEASASGNFEQGSDEQKVGDLFKSYMDLETRNKLGISPLLTDFNKVDEIENYNDLAAYFAYANKYGISVPFGLFIYHDFKNPTYYTLYTWQSGLGLPDRAYYLQDDEKSQELRVKYVDHIAKMFVLAGLENAEEDANVVMALETKLAEQQMAKEKTRDLVSLYNMLPMDSLSSITPNFNWTAYLNEAGIEGQDKIGILMLDYTKALDSILISTNIDTWKKYLKWGVINAYASRLNEDFDKQNASFYRQALWGIPDQKVMWRRGVSVVNQTLGEVVGKVYVKNHFPPEAKDKMVMLVENLLKAYEISIKDLDWMGKETKSEALEKLKKINCKIGYPDEWKAYDLEIRPDDLFGNLKRASLMEYNRDLAKLGQPIDKKEWGLTPQTVNAYYNPTMNEIVFPAAILQPPFFDMSVDEAVNYGAIGSVIGHEIGHGFDDMGSTFDGDGAMRNWWTDEDREEFEKRTAILVEQYNEFKALPDLNVNGEFTLGENIGDLGGLSIALKAYQLSLNGEESPTLDGYTGLQRFFIGYAQAWRGKMRDEALRTLINTDPHSPNEFRVNGIVRNIPEFYEAFNVQTTDSLYLAPELRAKIW